MFLLLLTLLYPIHDITTSPDNPPAFVYNLKLEGNEGRDLSYDHKITKRQRRLYPDLSPLQSRMDAEHLFQRALKIAKQQAEWKITDIDESNFRIEAVATSPVLKLAHDVMIEIHPESAGSSLHMRSKSRMQHADLGANYNRIRSFLDLVQK